MSRVATPNPQRSAESMTTGRTASPGSPLNSRNDDSIHPSSLTMGDVLRLIQAGELPPPGAASTMGLTISDVANDTATFEMIPAAEHLNAGGTVNGGAIAVLADFALGCAVNDIPATASVATVDLNIHYQRPITVDSGAIRAIAHVLHRTRRTATVAARIVDGRDELHAYATATIVIQLAPEQSAVT
jgi:uncharacterized protein (TIGR00369 family)